MFSQPVTNNLFSNSSLESPDVRVLELLVHHLTQPALPAVDIADTFVKFKTQSTHGGTILKLRLVINICTTKTIDLYTT